MSPASRLRDEPETPRELVAGVMNDNPIAGIERIKAIVWAKIADDESWLRSFVGETTERHAQSIVREMRERALAPKGNGSKGGDKFTGTPSAAIASAVGMKDGKPYVRVGTERIDIPAGKSAEQVALLEIERQKRHAEIRAHQDRANAALADAVASCTQHMMKISLLSMVMPNGKMLRHCTYGECAQFSGWYKLIALQGRPDNELVGKRMTDTDLRVIQTWED